MKLDEYFENAKGIGVLATADAGGKVNVALYARPHFLGDDDQEASFIMNDRLSHDNLTANPNAAYLFVEEGDTYAGKRLSLIKTGEETDPDKIESLRRRNQLSDWGDADTKKRFLVHFRVEGVRPLVGKGQ